ncbi:glutaredoxin-like isoform X2 [Cimex lectularius]|uniref:Glutaredoxin domain-containing protein n=1 Tax=Cimex lectularius TaxID=79782 RepID=A0A8I6RDM1_CIMLE|nr:glutaredoxin-like isoform X2 [Cimex lectularius]
MEYSQKKQWFKRELDGHIQSQRVVMFGKPGCNYCAEVRRIFASIGIAVKTIELDVYAPTDGLVLELMKRTGYTTVPQIFVDNEFIGGLVELKELYACGAIQDRLCRADVVYTKPERWKMKDFGYIRANQTQGREAKVDDEFSSSDDTEQSSDSDKQKK